MPSLSYDRWLELVKLQGPRQWEVIEGLLRDPSTKDIPELLCDEEFPPELVFQLYTENEEDLYVMANTVRIGQAHNVLMKKVD